VERELTTKLVLGVICHFDPFGQDESIEQAPDINQALAQYE
jgi:hypothetical protein